MYGYHLNDIFIRSPPGSNVLHFFNNYLFKNRLVPKNTSFKIEDNKVILLYEDIGYEFPTNQSSSLIELYNQRYTDLYGCCLNTQKLKVFLPRGHFQLPNGNINDASYPYETYDIANPSLICTGITDNDCTFFKRWYCRALRDLVGPNNMSKYDNNCNCHRFLPENRVFIKMGNHVNCYDKSCKVDDPDLTNNICQQTVCSNMLNIKDILSAENIEISNLALNLSCS